MPTAAVTSSFFAGLLASVAAVAMAPAASQAADEVEVTISIKDHTFEPADVRVPAGKAIKLLVKNLDDDVEEFESHPLKFEKLVAPMGEITVRLQPLEKGSYPFFGEYHEETAQGKVIAE